MQEGKQVIVNEIGDLGLGLYPVTEEVKDSSKDKEKENNKEE